MKQEVLIKARRLDDGTPVLTFSRGPVTLDNARLMYEAIAVGIQTKNQSYLEVFALMASVCESIYRDFPQYVNMRDEQKKRQDA